VRTWLSQARAVSRETKEGDIPGLPIFEELKIRAGQSGHRLALRIERHDIYFS
jgi:hypothetical protein